MSLRKHIPNTITLCNLLSGCTGIVFALKGQFVSVFVCLIASEVSDFLDGFSARALHAYSAIGKELDSLADLVSFGLLPAMTLFAYFGMANPELPLLRWVPFLLPAASALRLAKFNLDTRQTTGFLGLATTGCAMLLVPMAVYAFHTDGFLHFLMGTAWFIPLLTLACAYLLVCEIPMFSLKIMTGRLKAFLTGSIVLIAACLIREIHAPWHVSVSLCITLILAYYLVLNIAARFKK